MIDRGRHEFEISAAALHVSRKAVVKKATPVIKEARRTGITLSDDRREARSPSAARES